MKIIISAGGTGGHIYPALSIINKIKEHDKNSEILYIGTTDRMEHEIVPSLGIPYVGIKMSGLSKNIFKDVKSVCLLATSLVKIRKIIKEYNPDIVIGVGGYITFPVIYEASKLGYKTFIHEQNSIPGKSNKLLVNDYMGHGTHVAGIVHSVAPACNLMILKALDRHGEGEYKWTINAINYAISQKVDIISMSLGGYLDENI